MSGAGGWIVAGVVFELMALGGVVPLVWSVREMVQRGGAPEEPLFRGPIVRAKVNEGVVYEGVPGITARPAAPTGAADAPPPRRRPPRRRGRPRPRCRSASTSPSATGEARERPAPA